MNQSSVDASSELRLTCAMPRKPTPEKEKLVNLGLKVPPVYKEFLPTIMVEESIVYEAELVRAIWLKGFAAYRRENKLRTDRDTETLKQFVREQRGAREIDVDDNSEENGRGRNSA